MVGQVPIIHDRLSLIDFILPLHTIMKAAAAYMDQQQLQAKMPRLGFRLRPQLRVGPQLWSPSAVNWLNVKCARVLKDGSVIAAH